MSIYDGFGNSVRFMGASDVRMGYSNKRRRVKTDMTTNRQADRQTRHDPNKQTQELILQSLFIYLPIHPSAQPFRLRPYDT